MKDWDCPPEGCEKCEFHRTESWCARAIPINQSVYDEKYRIYMEGFWEGINWCEDHYHAMEELLEEYAAEIDRLEEENRELMRLP